MLEITNSASPATDLGFLLHKNPERIRSVELSFGEAHVFYPEANEDRCTAALLLRINPIDLVRARRGRTKTLDQYVNDRPYAASSHMSSAIAKVYGTALSGRCKDKPELVERPLPLEVKISVLPYRGGEHVLRNLFEPLGYTVEAEGMELDPTFPDWGPSPYAVARLAADVTVKDLLTHLYVLIPVLDNEKHYWVAEDEIEKLLRKGESWLADHPHQELIVNRYLRHRRRYTEAALARMNPEEGDPDETTAQQDTAEAVVEERISLNQQRIDAVTGVVHQFEPASLIDLGCGEGRYLKAFLQQASLRRIVGMDVSWRVLEIARERMKFDRMPERQQERI
ncbi:MAG: 3' terminal RNA ribose 2'-O-methyltransferase Hen1, partial [Verrucomicrobiota bacterium]